MKCPNCGAENGNLAFCEFCGTPVAENIQSEQERPDKKGCPQCGSSNIQFKRETQGEVRGKKSKRVIHRTVGFCKDCGATWYPEQPGVTKKAKKPLYKRWWFWLIVVALLASVFTPKDNDKNDSEETASIYENAEIVDLMNGFGTAKVGTISVARAEQSACTDEALTDWYFNYVQEHSDCNYHIIQYTDDPTKGVYTPGQGFIQKDLAMTEDEDGSFSIGDGAGSTYYTVDENSKTISMNFKMVDAPVIEEVKAKVESVIPDEYKNGNQFAVDVAGAEGDLLDCSLTLINESFADADYQGIAMELAQKIKDLDLGIGYFNIAFQSDDYSLEAISVLDDLSSHDVSETSITEY